MNAIIKGKEHKLFGFITTSQFSITFEIIEMKREEMQTLRES